MVRDLNRMLQEKPRGGNPDFQGFMEKHGQYFPPGIDGLDDLVEHLQRRSGQMQSLLDSMTSGMRQSLRQMMNDLLQDDRLRWDMMQLAANLEQLYIVLFSEFAGEVRPELLPELSWDEEEYGTNLQHALMLARHLLGKHKMGNRQIVLITDGELTAHLEGQRAHFSYPPAPRTILETLKEVNRCTRDRIVINTFMLEESRSLVEFVDQMTRINRGRAFFTPPERLGEYLLVDYVASKRKIIA